MLHNRRCRVVECQSSAPQPGQDCHHVAGLKTSSWEGHQTRHSSAAVVSDDCEHSPWPWGDARQSAQVGAACRSAYNYLRQLRPAVRSLSVEARKTVVHAFVSSRLDYCNSLLFGVTDSLVQRLQAVQNAAARLVSGTRRSEHVTPVLRQLHWLPVRQRIEFKMAVLVYKALNGLSPQYLADHCQLITTTGRRRLRSSNVATCDVPRTRTTLGDRSFTAAGAHLWNNLPLHLRDFELSLSEFRRLLKTHLFGRRSRRLVTYF